MDVLFLYPLFTQVKINPSGDLILEKIKQEVNINYSIDSPFCDELINVHYTLRVGFLKTLQKDLYRIYKRYFLLGTIGKINKFNSTQELKKYEQCYLIKQENASYIPSYATVKYRITGRTQRILEIYFDDNIECVLHEYDILTWVKILDEKRIRKKMLKS